MGIGRGLVLCLALLVLVSTFSLALDEVDKVFFQTQQDKLSAQFNSKVDTQIARMETEMKTTVTDAQAQIKSDLTQVVKDSLKALVIGLSGLIVITLAIFKVIDLKISSTRNIKKYEQLIQQKTEELNTLILTATNERNALTTARTQLIEYQKKLQGMDSTVQAKQQQVNEILVQMGMQPVVFQNGQVTQQFSSGASMSPGKSQFSPAQYIQGAPYQQTTFQQPVLTPTLPTSPSSKRAGWKTVMVIIIAVVLVILIGAVIYKIFFMH